MKKIFLALVTVATLLVLSTETSSAQAMWSNGNKVQMTYPGQLTGHNYYTFPSFDSANFKMGDTIQVNCSALQTWVFVDTGKYEPHKVIVLNPDSTLKPGATVYIEMRTIDTVRNEYINQGSLRIDTFVNKSYNDTKQYIYTGNNLFQKVPY